ncbi:hypothetical protein [Paraconexibacter algicola]|uniref:Uncharacterized protein n=1 Tax=Paraconexibacter algicola TaxID=2133960 RepID=A0A2T4UBJ7_9ACTN|nr:hypothetical protein [Paraconexibacter algicola]PTL54264.1 hypothetical protein C7Y72_21175 [Paraconexibacter algicola]
MHATARLRGHGLVLTPRAPFVLRRIGDGRDDRVAVQHGDVAATLDPRAPGSPELEAVAELLLADGPTPDGWLVEIPGAASGGSFAVRWPNHHALASSELPGVPFELWGPDGSSLFVQGPFDPPPAEGQMVAPGQAVADRGDAGGAHWLELAYADPQGATWRQRHHILPFGLVVSAQAPAAGADAAMVVAATLVGELLDHCPCTVEVSWRSADAGPTTDGTARIWRCPTCGGYWRGATRERARRLSPQHAAADLGLI